MALKIGRFRPSHYILYVYTMYIVYTVYSVMVESDQFSVPLVAAFQTFKNYAEVVVKTNDRII